MSPAPKRRAAYGSIATAAAIAGISDELEDAVLDRVGGDRLGRVVEPLEQEVQDAALSVAMSA